jgi:hypothetical protein
MAIVGIEVAVPAYANPAAPIVDSLANAAKPIISTSQFLSAKDFVFFSLNTDLTTLNRESISNVEKMEIG